MRCTLPSPLWFPTPFLSGLFFFHKTLLPLPSSYLKLKVRTQARFEVLQYNNQSGQFLLIRLCLLPSRMQPLSTSKLTSSLCFLSSFHFSNSARLFGFSKNLYIHSMNIVITSHPPFLIRYFVFIWRKKFINS